MRFVHDLEQNFVGFIIDHTIAKPLAKSLADSLTTSMRPFAPEAVGRFAVDHNRIQDNLNELEELQETARRREVDNVVSVVDEVRESISGVTIYKN